MYPSHTLELINVEILIGKVLYTIVIHTIKLYYSSVAWLISYSQSLLISSSNGDHRCRRTVGKHAKGSSCGNRSLVRTAVKTMSARVTTTDKMESTSMSAFATSPLTSWAYSVAARARAVRGKEYAHHATLNRLMDLLNRAGLDTCSASMLWSYVTQIYNRIEYIIKKSILVQSYWLNSA